MRVGSTANSRITARARPARIAGSPSLRRLVGALEPVPAGRRIGARRLLRIGDDEAELVGERVHPRSDGEIVRLLGAAVQHDDQRPARGHRRTDRRIDLVVPRARGAGEASRDPGRPRGNFRGRRSTQGARGRAGGKRQLFPQTPQDFAEAPPWGLARLARRPAGLGAGAPDATTASAAAAEPGRAPPADERALAGRRRLRTRGAPSPAGAAWAPPHPRSPARSFRHRGGIGGRRAVARQRALDHPRRLHHILRAHELQARRMAALKFALMCRILVRWVFALEISECDRRART